MKACCCSTGKPLYLKNHSELHASDSFCILVSARRTGNFISRPTQIHTVTLRGTAGTFIFRLLQFAHPLLDFRCDLRAVEPMDDIIGH